MAWTLTADIADFAGTVQALLSAQPERYTVLATVLDSLVRHGPAAYGDEPPVLATWTTEPGGEVRAAALQTPPHPMQVTELPGDSAAGLAAILAPRHAAGLTSVNGGEEDAIGFAAAWSALTGLGSRIYMRHRLYRLGELAEPDPMPGGAARVATQADADTVSSWDEAFAVETGQHAGPNRTRDARLDTGRLVLWERDGVPVAMATCTDAILGVARINQVYTPAIYRNRGYGGAATAAATKLAIDRGASSVLLFTDLANPVSNSLYLKLGYRAIEDKVVLQLERQA